METVGGVVMELKAVCDKNSAIEYLVDEITNYLGQHTDIVGSDTPNIVANRLREILGEFNNEELKPALQKFASSDISGAFCDILGRIYSKLSNGGLRIPYAEFLGMLVDKNIIITGERGQGVNCCFITTSNVSLENVLKNIDISPVEKYILSVYALAPDSLSEDVDYLRFKILLLVHNAGDLVEHIENAKKNQNKCPRKLKRKINARGTPDTFTTVLRNCTQHNTIDKCIEFDDCRVEDRKVNVGDLLEFLKKLLAGKVALNYDSVWRLIGDLATCAQQSDCRNNLQSGTYSIIDGAMRGRILRAMWLGMFINKYGVKGRCAVLGI